MECSCLYQPREVSCIEYAHLTVHQWFTVKTTLREYIKSITSPLFQNDTGPALLTELSDCGMQTNTKFMLDSQLQLVSLSASHSLMKYSYQAGLMEKSEPTE